MRAGPGIAVGPFGSVYVAANYSNNVFKIVFYDCGDGVIGDTEGYDDVNPDGGDGCSSTCTIEDGWDCMGEPSVCTLTSIPAVSEWGLIVMSLLVSTAGTLVYAQRRPVQA
ncbi:MAG: IPTL-CTERM sorting domain-containing protein [Phycisphaerae bacterium]